MHADGRRFEQARTTFNPEAKEWRQAKPPVCPPARSNHKLVWHDKLGALVMAGGNDGKAWLTDLWVYETAAERWTEEKPPTAPRSAKPGFATQGEAEPPPCAAATCYDASQGLLVLFNEKGQTWTCRIERQ